ncbi:MAG: substrate-binding domain-containing protein [Chloroflexia bacterium]
MSAFSWHRFRCVLLLLCTLVFPACDLLPAAPTATPPASPTADGTPAGPATHSDFLLLGSAADPAHVAGQQILPALRAIAASGATFVSRRDGSNANVFELQLWQKAMGRDVQHEGWYVSTHKGAGPTLAEANRRQAYTLTDRASYLAARGTLQLEPLVENDPMLLDAHHAIRAVHDCAGCQDAAPPADTGAASIVAWGAPAGFDSDRVTTKRLPHPSLLATLIVPPCCSAMRRAIARPRPSPEPWRASATRCSLLTCR